MVGGVQLRGIALAAIAALTWASAAVAVAAGSGSAPRHAGRADPPITVSTRLLAGAFHCHGRLSHAAREPVLLVTGTGTSGDETYALGKGAFDLFGHPVCEVNFPYFETADIQLSVQYLVAAIRHEHARSGRAIAIFAISQGGLLSRLALTYWPDLRADVSDVVAAAPTMHGTTLSHCSARRPCVPAGWQQMAGSHLLRAIDAYAPRAPGPTAWTTVRSASDEVVQPQTGPHAASALTGASNLLIQRICPGRTDTHIGTAVDSATFAAFADALAHPGPARVSRLPREVCAHPYAPGLDPTTTTPALLSGANALTNSQIAKQPTLRSEPKVKRYFLP
jgi:triacylglycerol lipase